MKMHPVFVYGTLRKGGSNHFRMNGAEFIGIGKICGAIYRIDWNPELIFPALVVDQKSRVIGEVYLVSDNQLSALDTFEGISEAEPEPHEYMRIKTQVVLDSGIQQTAWVWLWNRSLKGAELLESGDWMAHEPDPT